MGWLGAFAMLAYRPFLDPLPMDGHWLWLLLPLALAIAVVIKTIRLRNMSLLPKQVAILTSQIVLFMVLTAIGLWLLTQWV